MEAQELLIGRDGPVATLTLNRPEKRNALTFAMYEGLAEFCRTAGEDPDLKAIIITGAGAPSAPAPTSPSFAISTGPATAWPTRPRWSASFPIWSPARFP